MLKPLGLQSKKVIHHKTGNILEDIIQLVIPEAQSELNIKGDVFRKRDSCPRCGCTQYGLQILDFFPKFCDDFEFHICKRIEEFSGGLRRIIISKSFCDLLVKHKVIKFNTNQLIPVKQV